MATLEAAIQLILELAQEVQIQRKASLMEVTRPETPLSTLFPQSPMAMFTQQDSGVFKSGGNSANKNNRSGSNEKVPVSNLRRKKLFFM